MKYLVLTTVVLAILASSCQKEAEPGPGTPAGSGKLLVKYVYQEDDAYSTNSFVYDQQNRCIRLHQEDIDRTNPSQPTYSVFWNFHYNGNEDLPYKMTDSSEGRNMNYYFFYDSQKRKVKDSVVSLRYGYKWVTRYNYSGNRVDMPTVYTSNQGATVESVDTLESDGTNWVRHSYKHSQGYEYQEFFTYDNHPSAFSAVNLSKAFVMGTIIGLDVFRNSKNNPLTIRYHEDYVSIPDYGYNFSYAYDAEGYPVSATMIDITDPSTFYKHTFEYKK